MFFLPCDCSDQHNFGMTVLLTLSVNLVVVTNFIPETSRYFPRVCNYFLLSILQCIVGIILSSIVGHAKHFESSLKELNQSEMNMGDSQPVNDLEEEIPVRNLHSDNAKSSSAFNRCIREISKILSQHETLIGLIYLSATIFAHVWCYQGYFFN